MDIIDSFWNSSLEELKRGYIDEHNSFKCLLCGDQLEKGVIYPHKGSLYEAEKYMRIHVENAHGSVFEYLIGMDKKLTGLTVHQNKLLHLFYEGKSAPDIQQEMGIGSASTIRHHRFTLKEKERQAKVFLAMMELLKEKDDHAPSFIPIHKTAKMVDDRYNITNEEQTIFVEKYFTEAPNIRLKKFPLKEKQRLAVLKEVVKQIDGERMYDEKELNALLKVIYEDYVLLRRYLIEYGFMDRKVDGSEYWLKK